MQQAGLVTGTCTGASRKVLECICASNDSGKTTSPTGHWEVQMYTHHKEWLLCPIFWLVLWMVVKYEAPGWKVPVPAPAVLGQRQTAAAVLTGPIANCVQTVYPGKAGEELCVTWRGRYLLIVSCDVMHRFTSYSSLHGYSCIRMGCQLSCIKWP